MIKDNVIQLKTPELRPICTLDPMVSILFTMKSSQIKLVTWGIPAEGSPTKWEVANNSHIQVWSAVTKQWSLYPIACFWWEQQNNFSKNAIPAGLDRWCESLKCSPASPARKHHCQVSITVWPQAWETSAIALTTKTFRCIIWLLSVHFRLYEGFLWSKSSKRSGHTSGHTLCQPVANTFHKEK